MESTFAKPVLKKQNKPHHLDSNIIKNFDSLLPCIVRTDEKIRLTQKAYAKLYTMWYIKKSTKFIEHLIISFHNLNKNLNDNVTTILIEDLLVINGKVKNNECDLINDIKSGLGYTSKLSDKILSLTSYLALEIFVNKNQEDQDIKKILHKMKLNLIKKHKIQKKEEKYNKKSSFNLSENNELKTLKNKMENGI